MSTQTYGLDSAYSAPDPVFFYAQHPDPVTSGYAFNDWYSRVYADPVAPPFQGYSSPYSALDTASLYASPAAPASGPNLAALALGGGAAPTMPSSFGLPAGGGGGGAGASFVSSILGGSGMAAPASGLDWGSLFSTLGNTVSTVYSADAAASVQRARINADAARDAAALQAGYRYGGSSAAAGINAGSLVSSLLPWVGVALVGGIVLKMFKR